MKKNLLLGLAALITFLSATAQAWDAQRPVCKPHQFLLPGTDLPHFTLSVPAVCAAHAKSLNNPATGIEAWQCEGVTVDHPVDVDYKYAMSVLEPDGSRTRQDGFVPYSLCNLNLFPQGLATVSTVCPGQCEVTDVDPDKNRCPWSKNCPHVGNPINPLTGNKNQQEIDYNGPGAFALRFERHYNSSMEGGAVAANANLSVTWSHSYARSISNRSALPNAASMRRGEGTLLYFQFAGGLWRPDADVPVKLERLVDGAGATTGWRYTSETDELETYDAAGRLVSIANREGLTQTLTYDAQGRLFQVTDAWGKQLTFAYDGGSNLISTMTDPAGGVYTYAYDGFARLVSVTYPGVAVRTIYTSSAAANC